MSDEIMSRDQFDGADDLAAIEARLAGEPLAAPRINRDELMYRAGWAACEVTQRLHGPALGKVKARRRAVAGWSAASAALAASLAVALTLSVAPRTHQLANTADSPHKTLAGVAEASAPSTPRRIAFDPVLARLDAIAGGGWPNRRSASGATLWKVSSQALPGRWDEPILAMADSASPAPSSVERATARQLLDELLPPRARAAKAFPADSPIEVPSLLRPFAVGGDTI
jgi:hypothetical protein